MHPASLWSAKTLSVPLCLRVNFFIQASFWKASEPVPKRRYRYFSSFSRIFCLSSGTMFSISSLVLVLSFCVRESVRNMEAMGI